MIIVFSGWRGPPRRRPSSEEKAANAAILTALTDVMGRVFSQWPDAHYRVGDCESGVDSAFMWLWNHQADRGGWWKGPPGKRTVEKFYADFRGPLRLGAGPDRNRRMLRGDGTYDDRHGIANQLIALPQPGPRQPHSGTWDCIDAARELSIPIMMPPIMMHPAHVGGDRMPGLSMPPR